MLPDWTEAHAAGLREYLNTESGQKLLDGLTAITEAIPAGKTLEEEALCGREARGARKILQAIHSAYRYKQSTNPSEEPYINIESEIPQQHIHGSSANRD